VQIHPVALSSHAGSAKLHIPVDKLGIEHDASASIEQTGFEQSRDELVPLRTLDSFDFHRVSLIKIDVEGHEYSVIEGATITIETLQPALLTELEKFNLLAHQSMANFNGVEGLYINNFLFLHRDRISSGEYDAVFSGLLLK
jgi:hypothetical protein